jgi:dipeptidyl aminopeptidase/acylaminoacyl peptidase
MPLSGILSLPITVNKTPLIIIVPAAGPTDFDGNFNSKPYKDLAVGLATNGYAVFRYNKRSLNYGFNFLQNKLNGVTFTPREDLLNDLQAAINLLKKNPNIDSTKIYLLGHGEGAYFAPFIANENPFIKGIILMGANANHPLEMMMDQNKYLGKILPHKKEHFDEDDAKAKIVLKRKVKENTSYLLLPHEIPASYWLWINKYNQIKTAKKLAIPIFIMQGGRDYQVDKKNFLVWEKKLKKHKNVTLKMYEKMNHIMHAGEGESTYSEYAIMRHIPLEVINDLQVWLQKN